MKSEEGGSGRRAFWKLCKEPHNPILQCHLEPHISSPGSEPPLSRSPHLELNIV